MGDVRYIPFILLFINALLFTAGSTSVEEDEDVDLHPFIKVGSKYYLFAHGLKMDWFGAVHLCRSYDSDLLTIESLDEHNVLVTPLWVFLLFSNTGVWTSINDLAVEGTYMSLNSGRPMLYKFWGQNEPHNEGDAEDCVEIVRFGAILRMNDNKCSIQRQIICEKRSPLIARNSATKSNCEKTD